MPLRTATEPLSAGDRRRLQAIGDDQPRRLAGKTLIVLAGVAAAASSFLTISKSPLGAAVLALTGTVVAVIGLLQLAAHAFMAQGSRRDRDVAANALQRGVAEVIVLDLDAAWYALALDEDLPAVLLRCDPQTFVYLNTHLLEGVMTEREASKHDIPSSLIVRRTPGPEPRLLSITGAGRPLAVRSDLFERPAEEAAILAQLSALGSDFIVLTADQLPAAWRATALAEAPP